MVMFWVLVGTICVRFEHQGSVGIWWQSLARLTPQGALNRIEAYLILR